MMTPFEDRIGSLAKNEDFDVADPSNMVFDSKSNRLLLLDNLSNELLAIKAEPDRYLNPARGGDKTSKIGQLGIAETHWTGSRPADRAGAPLPR